MTTPTPTIPPPTRRIPTREIIITSDQLNHFDTQVTIFAVPSQSREGIFHTVKMFRDGRKPICFCESGWRNKCCHRTACQSWLASEAGLRHIQERIAKTLTQCKKARADHESHWNESDEFDYQQWREYDGEVDNFLSGVTCPQNLSEWDEWLERFKTAAEEATQTVATYFADRAAWEALTDDQKADLMGDPFTGQPFKKTFEAYCDYFQGNL